MVKVSFYNETVFEPRKPDLRAAIAETLRAERTELEEVTVSFISAEAIKTQNRKHRTQDVPTNVLSFPFDGSFPHGSGGEILISPDMVGPSMNSAEQQHRVAHLVVHATLHLLGHDDQTEDALGHMEEKTKEILGRRVRHGT